jgi:hypothetical protein
VASISKLFMPRRLPTGTAYRITAQFPVEPYDDVFSRMTDQQSTEFKGRIDMLKGYLDEATRTGSSAPLRRALGSDFPE